MLTRVGLKSNECRVYEKGGRRGNCTKTHWDRCVTETGDATSRRECQEALGTSGRGWERRCLGTHGLSDSAREGRCVCVRGGGQSSSLSSCRGRKVQATQHVDIGDSRELWEMNAGSTGAWQESPGASQTAARVSRHQEL